MLRPAQGEAVGGNGKVGRGAHEQRIVVVAMPCGEAEYCELSYEPENETARTLYRSFGFEEQALPEGWDKVPAVF